MSGIAKLFGPVKEQLSKGRAPETSDPAEIARRIERMKTSGARNFGPADGICWACNQQIFTILSGEGDVTRCPLCHRTYVD